MTVYNVNLGIGWASSGIEYAQKYRSDAFKQEGIKAKFIFSDLILGNNIEALTKNMGFADEQIIWLYNFFTDIKIAPSTFTLGQLEKKEDFAHRQLTAKHRNGKEVVYTLTGENLSIVARLVDEEKQTIDQVSYLRNNVLLLRDFYSYTKYAREYYRGGGNNDVTVREFYNEDGSIAYIQHLNNGQETFEFPQQHIFYSKNDLYRAMIKGLHLGEDDFVIIDREDENKNLSNGQIIFEEHKPAKLLVAIHADHFNKEFSNQAHVLWNNFYEYQFTHYQEVNAYVVATAQQKQVLEQQFAHYYHVHPCVLCIPVGNLPNFKPANEKAKPHSLITASRLASEKHIDWLVSAVVAARKSIPDVSLDIYGSGSLSSKLQGQIGKDNAQSYIHLMGQQDLSDVYGKYGAYIAASTSEGFGLSLMEAVGSGLPMIGFDVPYGNPTFIDNGRNGYLLPYDEDWSDTKKCHELSAAIVKLFKQRDLKSFHIHSYQIAEPYLRGNVAKTWKKDLENLQND